MYAPSANTFLDAFGFFQMIPNILIKDRNRTIRIEDDKGLYLKADNEGIRIAEDSVPSP